MGLERYAQMNIKTVKLCYRSIVDRLGRRILVRTWRDIGHQVRIDHPRKHFRSKASADRDRT